MTKKLNVSKDKDEDDIIAASLLKRLVEITYKIAAVQEEAKIE